jgi:hypothetical protein
MNGAEEVVDLTTGNEDHPQAPANTSSVRSFVWKYFKSINSNKILCNICKKQLKFSKQTTSNMINHLSRIHKISKSSHTLSATVETNTNPCSIQMTIHDAIAGGFSQEQFDKAVITCVVKADAPFLTIENPGIKLYSTVILNTSITKRNFKAVRVLYYKLLTVLYA